MIKSLLACSLLLSSCVDTKPPKGDSGQPPLERLEIKIPGEDIIAIGDFGTGGKEQYAVGASIAAYCKNHTCDAGITVGDNFYPAGVKDKDDALWKNAFDLPYKDVNLTFYPTLGNHDYSGNYAAQITTRPKWRMPYRYYKLITPKAVFFALDLEHFDDTQRQYLDKELGAVQKTSKLVVLYGHRPVFSSGGHGDTIELKKLLLPIIQKHKVPVVIAGHDHHLEAIERDGTYYLISGSAGKTRSARAGDHTKFVSSEYGFLHIDFQTDRVDFNFVGLNSRPLHSFTIKGVFK